MTVYWPFVMMFTFPPLAVGLGLVAWLFAQMIVGIGRKMIGDD